MEKTRLSGHGSANRLNRWEVFRYPRFIREGPWLKKAGDEAGGGRRLLSHGWTQITANRSLLRRWTLHLCHLLPPRRMSLGFEAKTQPRKKVETRLTGPSRLLVLVRDEEVAESKGFRRLRPPPENRRTTDHFRPYRSNIVQYTFCRLPQADSE